MDRIVKIAIYLAVLFFLSIWISSVVKSCSSTPADVSDNTNTEVLDEFEEDFFEDDIVDEEEDYTSDMGGGAVESDYEPDDFASEYVEIDEVIENKTTNTKPATLGKSSSYGKYMVLAGSYLVEGNASNMVNKLDRLGYDNAEIVVFNMSQYHSVCAARFSDYNAAVQLSNELKRKGVDNYVHTKQ